MKCEVCGTIIPEGKLECPNCGYKYRVEKEKEEIYQRDDESETKQVSKRIINVFKTIGKFLSKLFSFILKVFKNYEDSSVEVRNRRWGRK